MNQGVVCLLAVLAATGCRGTEREDDEHIEVATRVDDRGRVVLTDVEVKTLDLHVVTVERETLPATSLRYGRVSARPEEQALVVAPFTGRLAAPPTVALGAEVTQGAPLLSVQVVVDTASRAGLAAQRRELQGQLEGSRARVRAFESERARVASLVDTHLATDADLARAQADLKAEQARLDGLKRAGGELAVVTGGAVVIRAPVAGVVVALESDVGELLQPGQTLVRIVQAGPRWIDVSVAPEEPVGTSYRVRAGSGWMDARLLARGAVVGADGTRHDRIELASPSATAVLPGSTVAVEVVRASEGVAVPETAVVMRGTEPAVFVEVEPNRFAVRAVELGAHADGRVVVSGVEPGQRVVTRGAPALLGELGDGTTDGPTPIADPSAP